ncbi:MAG: hypothetical protein AAF988_07805 [Pseudomonadota bacterium]
MDNEHFDGIKAGLEDVLAYMQGDETRVRLTKVPVLDIKALREQLGMSQGNLPILLAQSSIRLLVGTVKRTNVVQQAPCKSFYFCSIIV